MLPEAEQKELEAIHREVVESTLRIAEEMFGVVRRGQGGKIHQKAGLTFAVIDEFTSRANDMQMHSHCLLVNAGVTGLHLTV
jgi:TrwC relaxase